MFLRNSFEYHMYYFLYQFVNYLLTLPHTKKTTSVIWESQMSQFYFCFVEALSAHFSINPVLFRYADTYN
jgi:hypothetical protein